MRDPGNLDAVVIDLGAVRQGRLENEQLRLLATAVGDPSRLERVRAQLRVTDLGPRAAESGVDPGKYPLTTPQERPG